MKLSKHQLRRVLRKVIKEHVTDEEHDHPHADESDEHHCGDESLNEADQGLGAGTLEDWVANDDAVLAVGTPGTSGVYEWGCDATGGEYEMEYIIKRIRELYSLGGAIEKIEILDMR